MVQERFLYLKEINLKQLLIFSLILSLNIASNEVLNKFNSLIKKDLYFSQEIETNTMDKSFSEGSIQRYGENIEVIIAVETRTFSTSIGLQFFGRILDNLLVVKQ